MAHNILHPKHSIIAWTLGEGGVYWCTWIPEEEEVIKGWGTLPP
jgi:hypothetical protein